MSFGKQRSDHGCPDGAGLKLVRKCSLELCDTLVVPPDPCERPAAHEVFLASRIRERYVRGGDARRAVTEGVGAVGRVIVAAATIMAVVFWAFTLNDDGLVKSFGLGLGVPILADALVVRMILVPAIMHLLGDKAWYMPRRLDSLLPRLTIEPPEPTVPTSTRPGEELPQAA